MGRQKRTNNEKPPENVEKFRKTGKGKEIREKRMETLRRNLEVLSLDEKGGKRCCLQITY